MSLITSASRSGLGLFSNINKVLFPSLLHLLFFCQQIAFVAPYHVNFLWRLAAQTFCSIVHIFHLPTLSSILFLLRYIVSPLLSFLKLFFTSRSFFLYSCCSLAFSRSDLVPANFCFNRFLSSIPFQHSGLIQLFFFLVL